MADLDDFELDRPPVDPDPPRRRMWPVAALVLLLVIAGAAWYFWPRDRSMEPPVRTGTEQAVRPQTSTIPLPAEPGENIDLPPLGESDAVVRELVTRLSSHPRVAAWLTSDHLLRDFVAIVVNISQGQTPTPHLTHVKPQGTFQTQQQGAAIRIDPRSYSRYDSYASAVAELDAQGAARLYATLRPRIDEAYGELGAPDGDFDRTFQKALVQLLETPIVEGDVGLASTSVSYSFADPALEGLAPVQRQFLRMGPRNMRLVRAKLVEIAGFLGIPPDSLPAERVVRSRG
jgi:hypothetical protein